MMVWMFCFRCGHQEAWRRGTRETDGSHGEDRWRDRWHSALRHHLPRCGAGHEETVTSLQSRVHLKERNSLNVTHRRLFHDKIKSNIVNDVQWTPLMNHVFIGGSLRVYVQKCSWKSNERSAFICPCFTPSLKTTEDRIIDLICVINALVFCYSLVQ